MAGWKIVGAFIHYEDRVIHSPFTTKIVPVTVVVQASAVVVPTLNDAIKDCQFVVGTSARERRIPWPLLDARSCAERIASASSSERVPPAETERGSLRWSSILSSSIGVWSPFRIF